MFDLYSVLVFQQEKCGVPRRFDLNFVNGPAGLGQPEYPEGAGMSEACSVGLHPPARSGQRVPPCWPNRQAKGLPLEPRKPQLRSSALGPLN